MRCSAPGAAKRRAKFSRVSRIARYVRLGSIRVEPVANRLPSGNNPRFGIHPMDHDAPATPKPHTKAWSTFETNLDQLMHLLEWSQREVDAAAALLKAWSVPVDVTTPAAVAARISELQDGYAVHLARLRTATLWKVVMLVTCTETYLQDVLAAAARVDASLMRKSEQQATYASVLTAASLEALADEMRQRWARGWLNDGGPRKWTDKLVRMGARFPEGLAERLERIWGIRHLIVHNAGVVTGDFVKRYPNANAVVGEPVPLTHHDFGQAVEACTQFLSTTEEYFLARVPSLAVAILPNVTTKQTAGT